MPKAGRPRFGSMGVWPRKRAKRQYARIRNNSETKEAKPVAFPGYKAGMTRLLYMTKDNTPKKSDLKVATAATIIECPPIKIASLRLYKKENSALKLVKQFNFKTEKELARKLSLPKTAKLSKPEDLDKINPEEYDDATIQVYTNPKLIKLKKTPEIFEVRLGGSSVKEKIDYVKSNVDKNILVTDIFKEAQFVDAHAITSGKGYQGPVKRFGIGLKHHKSEKGRRRPGSLGGWKAQAHFMHRVAYAGQTGYHQRTQYNNLIMKIGDNPEEVNPKGGFVRYGDVKTTYLLVKGSIPGPRKRLITLTQPIRPAKLKKPFTSQAIKKIITSSQQGN